MTRFKIKNIQLHNPLEIMKKLFLIAFELLDVIFRKIRTKII